MTAFLFEAKERMLSTLSTRQLALLLAINMAMTPFAVDAYLPAMPQLAAHLGASVQATAISLSVFLLGFAVGQLIFGPISDWLGRRPVVLTGALVFFLSSLALTQVTHVHALWVLRFVQALGGGACAVNASAIVRDQFSGREAARVLSTMLMLLLLAPLTAPSIGTLLMWIGGWQLIFLFLAAYAAGVGILVALKLPETRIRGVRPSIPRIFRNYGQVLTHRAGIGYIAAVACSYAGIFSFLASSPYLCLTYYHLPEQYYALMFASNVILVVSFNRLNLTLLKHHAPRRILRIGLMVQGIASVLAMLVVVSGLDTFWSLMPLVIMFCCINGLINANAVSSLLDHFPHMSGTANAVMGCLQFGAGALASALVNAMGDSGPWPLVSILLCAAIISNVLIRWLASPLPDNQTAA